MFTEAQNFAIAQTELDAVFYQRYSVKSVFPGDATAATSEIFKVKNTDRASYITQTFGGTGLFSKIGETQTVPEATPSVTNKMTTYVSDYAQDVYISKDLFDDNLHDAWANEVQNMAFMALKTQDSEAFAIFRNAFTTTLTADGVSFINAAHPLIGGGTQSNLISGALSTTTLNNATVSLYEQKNQAGVPMGNTPRILLVPPTLWQKATEYTQSVLLPDSGNNNVNVFMSPLGFKVYTSQFLGASAGGSDTAWFLLSDNHSVSRLIRQGVETALVDWKYSTNRSYKYTANYRESYFVTDYIGAVGSTGV